MEINKRINRSERLREIQEWQENIEEEKSNIMSFITNRLFMPSMILTTTKKWDTILQFEKDQELRRIEFYKQIKEM